MLGPLVPSNPHLEFFLFTQVRDKRKLKGKPTGTELSLFTWRIKPPNVMKGASERNAGVALA